MSLVSVIIPTFNRARFLKRAVDSVLAQTYKDLELIVVNDGSCDDTFEMLAHIADSRLKIIHLESNVGVSKARNIGFSHSKGEWIALLDSDDEWLSHRLEIQMNYIDSMPAFYPLIHGEEIWIRNGKRINQKKIHQKSGGDLFERSLELCLISPSASLIHRKCWEEFNGFDEDFVVCEDYDLWLRLTSKYEVGFINEPIIIKYGGHDDQLSIRYKAMDYWRVKSIDQLLRSKTSLTDVKKKKAIEVILKKSQILRNGYLKHENLEHLEFVEEILRRYS